MANGLNYKQVKTTVNDSEAGEYVYLWDKLL